jgi:hypothetical protein
MAGLMNLKSARDVARKRNMTVKRLFGMKDEAPAQESPSTGTE